MSNGRIIAIIISCIVALIAVTAAAFAFKRRTDVPLSVNVNMGNNKVEIIKKKFLGSLGNFG